MFDLGFIRKKNKSARADAVPRTLSEALLEELTGACQLPDTSENDRRAFGRICIGTRATMRLAAEDSQPVSVLLRDLCVVSVGILVDAPLIAGDEYWIYIPKPQDPDDIVALCCKIVRCDPGGFERSAHVAAASFIEGQPPPLAASAEQSNAVPNQSEEEGHRPFVPRPGSNLFLRSDDPTTAPQATAPGAAEEPAAAEPVPEPAAPAASAPAPVEIVTPPPVEAVAPTPTPIVAPTPLEILAPAATPVAAPAPLEIVAPTPPAVHCVDAAPFTPQQIRRMADTVKPHLAYLRRMINRMDQQGIRSDDPIRQELYKAYQAVEQLQRRLESNAAEAPQPTAKHTAKNARPKNDAIDSLILLRRATLLPSIN